MASVFHFKDVQFGVNTEGFHLLRNGFPYKSIPVQEVQSMSIVRGHEYQRWLVVLVLGAALMLASMVYAVQLYNFIMYGEERFYIEAVAAILLPFCLGMLLTYLAFRKALVLKVVANGKKRSFSLKKIEEQGQLEAFKAYLRKTFSWVEVV